MELIYPDENRVNKLKINDRHCLLVQSVTSDVVLRQLFVYLHRIAVTNKTCGNVGYAVACAQNINFDPQS